MSVYNKAYLEKTSKRGAAIRISFVQKNRASEVILSKTEPLAGVLQKQLDPVISKSKKRIIRYGLLGVNILILLSVAVLIVVSHGVAARNQTSVLHNNAASSRAINPLDTLSSADIAVNVALMTRLPQSTAVQNHADSASTKSAILPSGSQAVATPQIVATGLKSVNDVKEYVVKEGDTLDSIANAFGVSSKSIRWSNNLSGSSVSVGSTLIIPPVEGIVYTVVSGDTVDSIATKFRGSKDRIVAFNDAEINGLQTGERIVIPDGEIVPVQRYFGGGVAAGFKATYGPANGYDFGWCTWHAANRRRELGNPVPTNLGNAVTWSARARAAGMTVSDTPIAGAVIWHDQSKSGYVAGGLGHVAFVESVNADGSIIVSDMNSRGVANADLTGPPAGGWARVSYRLVTPAEFYKYDFIY